MTVTGAGDRPLVVLPVLAALFLAASGCGDGAPPRADDGDLVGFSARDSAGIVVAENTADRMDAVPRWRTAPEPALRTGTVEGDAAYQFSSIPDAATLSDGRIVALDLIAAELRFYDPQGRHLRSVGGQGEGPGEFRFASDLWRLPGDSIAVWDRQLRRITVFTPAGRFARTFAPANIDRMPMPTTYGAFDDGSLVVGQRRGVSEDGIERLAVWTIRPDGTADSVGEFPGNRRSGPSWPIYGWRTALTPADSTVWVGTNRDYRIVEYDLAGRPIRVVRWTGPDRTVTDDDWEAYFRGYVARTRTPPEGEADLRRSLRDIPVADIKPAYTELRTDAAGNLWVGDYTFPWQTYPREPTRWWVFAPDGRLIARATLPARFNPYEIGTDYVLGRLLGDDDVQYLVRYPIRSRRAGL